jgi:L-glutamine-phosphate cytidylyltransferase
MENKKIRVLILAAGKGTRLLPITAEKPKCLIEVGGKAILDRQLKVLKSLGIFEIAIMTGYKSEKITDHLKGEKITFIHSDEYEETNNAYSLWLARDWLTGHDGENIVINSDLIFYDDLIETLLKSESEISIVVDRNVEEGSDQVKARMEGDQILETRKDLPYEISSAELIGPVKFNQSGTIKFLDFIGGNIESGHRNNWFFYELGKYGLNDEFNGIHNPGCVWAEVDNQEDLEIAEEILKKYEANR